MDVPKDLCTAQSSAPEEDRLHQALSQARATEAALRLENFKLKAGLEEALQELEDARTRDAGNLTLIATLRSDLEDVRRSRAREENVDGRRDDAMREFFEMVCFSIKLKYGPFSDEKLVVSNESSADALYDRAMQEKVPMWDWPVWVERTLMTTIASPAVHAAKKLSRVCNWDGTPSARGTLGGSVGPRGGYSPERGTLARNSEEVVDQEEVLAGLTHVAAGDSASGSGSLL